MAHRQTATTTALFVGTFIIAATAAPKTDRSPQDLRSQLAGAWRNEQHNDVLHFIGDLCISAFGSQQTVFMMKYEGSAARRTMAFSGAKMPGTFTMHDGRLVIRVPARNIEVTYSRLSAVPDSVRIDPYALGTRTPSDQEIAGIKREIAERETKEQAIRRRSIKAGSKADDASITKDMLSIDQKNTLRMIDLIQDVGWLNQARFGQDTQRGAFLIVQHSGNLRLMRTVLPLIRQGAKTNQTLGQLYALLYDRLQMNFGRQQRYGTQASQTPEGNMVIDRLEDRGRVDQWRREMGMEPLADYARELGKMQGAKVTIGE